jgi:ribosomal protein S1
MSLEHGPEPGNTHVYDGSEAIIDERLRRIRVTPKGEEIQPNPVRFTVAGKELTGEVIDKTGSGTYIVWPDGGTHAVEESANLPPDQKTVAFTPYRVRGDIRSLPTATDIKEAA